MIRKRISLLAPIFENDSKANTAASFGTGTNRNADYDISQ
jgi:hypothetical protein